MEGERPKMPAWLVGLILAAVIFAVVFIVLATLGYGDDPVVESLAGIR